MRMIKKRQEERKNRQIRRRRKEKVFGVVLGADWYYLFIIIDFCLFITIVKH